MSTAVKQDSSRKAIGSILCFQGGMPLVQHGNEHFMLRMTKATPIKCITLQHRASLHTSLTHQPEHIIAHEDHASLRCVAHLLGSCHQSTAVLLPACGLTEGDITSMVQTWVGQWQS